MAESQRLVGAVWEGSCQNNCGLSASPGRPPGSPVPCTSGWVGVGLSSDPEPGRPPGSPVPCTSGWIGVGLGRETRVVSDLSDVSGLAGMVRGWIGEGNGDEGEMALFGNVSNLSNVSGVCCASGSVGSDARGMNGQRKSIDWCSGLIWGDEETGALAG